MSDMNQLDPFNWINVEYLKSPNLFINEQQLSEIFSANTNWLEPRFMATILAFIVGLISYHLLLKLFGWAKEKKDRKAVERHSQNYFNSPVTKLFLFAIENPIFLLFMMLIVIWFVIEYETATLIDGGFIRVSFLLQLFEKFSYVFFVIGSMIAILGYDDWKKSKIHERKLGILDNTYKDFIKIYNFIKNLRGTTVYCVDEDNDLNEVGDKKEYAKVFLEGLRNPDMNDRLDSFLSHKSMFQLMFGNIVRSNGVEDIFLEIQSLTTGFRYSCNDVLNSRSNLKSLSEFFPTLPYKQENDVVMQKFEKVKNILEGMYKRLT